MWDDAVLKVSPLLAAVSTVLLVLITAIILTAEAGPPALCAGSLIGTR